MNELSRLAPPKGAKKTRKRVGRGPGSTGKTSGRGHKGQKARAAAAKFVGFEGGQMPLQRRLPKRGFTPLSRTRYSIVNLVELDELETSTITPAVLKAEGLIRSEGDLIKILGDGDVSNKLTVSAHKFSKSAQAKIEKAGGSCVVLSAKPAKKAEAKVAEAPASDEANTPSEA